MPGNQRVAHPERAPLDEDHAGGRGLVGLGDRLQRTLAKQKAGHDEQTEKNITVHGDLGVDLQGGGTEEACVVRELHPGDAFARSVGPIGVVAQTANHLQEHAGRRGEKNEDKQNKRP